MLFILKESSCLGMSYLEHQETSHGPRSLTCDFFTCNCCQPIHRSFSQGAFFVLPPVFRSHSIIIYLHCVVPLLLHLNGLSKTCIHLSNSTKSSYGNTIVRPCVQLRSKYIFNYLRKGMLEVSKNYRMLQMERKM